MTALLQGANPSLIGGFLAEALGDPAWKSCQTSLIAGGRSNLTYRVTSCAGTVVLRRPPLGILLPRAHDVRREARIMRALATTAVPVPEILAEQPDPDLLGQPFYVMAWAEGHVCRADLPSGYAESRDDRREISLGLVQVLADLHDVNPSHVGMEDLGRADGYFQRQLKRWQDQWEASGLGTRPALTALHADLAANVPQTRRATIVHGDYRLDNMVLDPHHPGRVAAVLDWEMSTLGDPLADLGMLLVYWSQADDDRLRRDSTVVPSTTHLDGFLTREEVAETYAQRTHRDLSDLFWAQALGFYKLAVVCAGIGNRVRAGEITDDGVDVLSKIDPLIELGRATMADGKLH